MQFHDDKLLAKAEATDAVKLFRWFAEFPLVEKLDLHPYTVLRYRDLRFRSVMPSGQTREGMFVVVDVAFDAQGNVISASLGSERE